MGFPGENGKIWNMCDICSDVPGKPATLNKDKLNRALGVRALPKGGSLLCARAMSAALSLEQRDAV